MQRRQLLALSSFAGLGACRPPQRPAPPAAPKPQPFRLIPVRADADRIFRITVCLRPFRAAGPRLDVERVGEQTVVHNYGHGGSGWSLSWGSGRVAAGHALATGEREIGVLGCGALGLTAATLLQQAGARVTIYAKERPSETRSARATGSYTPDSRIALAGSVDVGFPERWEQMARYSYERYQSFLGLAGTPVEWTDRYALRDEPQGDRRRPGGGPLEFAHYLDRLAPLVPSQRELPPGSHPFPVRHAYRTSSLTFNITALMHQLFSDFLLEGGRFVRAEFQTPADLARLPHKTLVNCTGYGARALWKDDSLVPVRGQINWLIPQPEINYGLSYRGVYVLARRDGIVVQEAGSSESEGYNDTNEAPDRAQAERAVGVMRELFSRMT